jgi:predicted AlkP superfamily pyrophosphatase or phosphodiesterase
MGTRSVHKVGIGRTVAVLVAFLQAHSACTSVASRIGPETVESRRGPHPTLVVQITVDQLRGDLPMRFRDRLGKGGFRYLLEQGVHYTNAHQRHANTETAVGHATLVTGADPSAHGIVANDWRDPATGAFVYNTEDDRHHILGQEPKAHQGVSPRNLLATTIGDELILSNAGRSRVFSVSGKDRGAILPGGHAGKAFWYSKSSGMFVTSSYYYDAYPSWVEAWNGAAPAESYRGKAWELLHEKSAYLAADHDDRAYEAAALGMGRIFPHPYGDDAYLTLRLGITPPVDELTLDFAKALIHEEELGKRGVTDFIALSFSATDYVGHLFGPSSLESEDVILRLDRILAELFRAIDEAVGIENALIVLCADHGAPEAPEYASEFGIEAGRFPFAFFKKSDAPVSRAVAKRFGLQLIADHSHPYLHLDEAAIRAAGLDLAEVERFVAREAIQVPGIYYALSRSDILDGRLANASLQEKIRRSFSPGRSGNVHLVQNPYWFLHSTDEADKMGLPALAAIHGSPWAYDTYVPIFFAGGRLEAQTISRRVSPTDIAPTIAAYLGIKYPSGSLGTPLAEVLGGAD